MHLANKTLRVKIGQQTSLAEPKAETQEWQTSSFWRVGGGEEILHEHLHVRDVGYVSCFSIAGLSGRGLFQLPLHPCLAANGPSGNGLM